MKEDNYQKASIMPQKEEKLLKKKLAASAFHRSEDQTPKLIQKLEENQLKIIKLKNELKLAKDETRSLSDFVIY